MTSITDDQRDSPDAGFRARFDRERARVLRLRFVVYCLLALAAFGMSLLGDSYDWSAARAKGTPISGLTTLSFAWDGGMAALYLAMLVYLLAARPDRRRLVLFVTALTLVAVAASAAFEGFLDLIDPAAGGQDPGRSLRIHAGWMSVASSGFLVVLALVLVPMSRREWLRLAAPAWVMACASIVLIASPPALPCILQCLAAGAGIALGGTWSSWRYGEFDEHFRSREVAAQLGDMSAELAYARRIHEALFPPPIEQGPVRVAYRYEPMRAIGGDFLFVWPLAFPPSTSPEPVHVVLIDVSGHGVSAALTVNRLHDELRRFFAEQPAGGAGRLIDRLNAFTFDQLAPHGVFVTAVCLRVDPSSGELEWANAGHPPALLRRAAELERLDATAPMLGVAPADLFSASALCAKLEPGQSVLAYTDGAYDGLNPKASGLDELLGIIRSKTDLKGISAAIADLRGGPATDDLLIVEVSLPSA